MSQDRTSARQDDAGVASAGASGADPVSPELAEALARMSGLLLAHETVQTAVGLVTALIARTLPRTAGAGVTLVDDRGKRTAAATDPVVEAADALQYELDQGPCLSAWRYGQLVRIDDVEHDGRWPAWAAAVSPAGVRSVLSAPLVAGGQRLGALKAYSTATGAYTEADEAVLRLFAEQASVLLANVASHESVQRTAEQLKEALSSRDVIGQAKGVLIAQGAPDEDAAFTMLSSASQRSNTKLVEVARELVASVIGRRRNTHDL
ncbi:GAF and ANTAR domain-containing protein [Quadrisphaera sp. DSM 44207]|uniref:GAF and ANTAR domain-containing protein n=1 Tax=Quadrisphaera sp. DSM 44207 TaxID=1881057 RepID=UPI0008826514|nr:GAF and ANTAR domain-containing protein [Quadrisphaera sp. DSM 44207]SDQ05785.1 GAF domain-containing protein [Quadrisphaera sp. DSM 44207]